MVGGLVSGTRVSGICLRACRMLCLVQGPSEQLKARPSFNVDLTKGNCTVSFTPATACLGGSTGPSDSLPCLSVCKALFHPILLCLQFLSSADSLVMLWLCLCDCVCLGLLLIVLPMPWRYSHSAPPIWRRESGSRNRQPDLHGQRVVSGGLALWDLW